MREAVAVLEKAGALVRTVSVPDYPTASTARAIAACLAIAVSFFDGQNLFRHAKSAFGRHRPNHDPMTLGKAVCAARNRICHGVRFHTGTPGIDMGPGWRDYWNRRLLGMRRDTG